MGNAFSDALAPLASKMPAVVREHELLRIAGALDAGADPDTARAAVVDWLEARTPLPLPAEAWSLQPFAIEQGGLKAIAVRVDQNVNIWALRVEEQDTDVAQKTWITEIFIGGKLGAPARISLRCLALTPEADFEPVPVAPDFMARIMGRTGFTRGRHALSARAELVDSDEKAQLVCDDILDVERRLPIIAISEIDATGETIVSSDDLAHRLAGVARVIQIKNQQTFIFSRRFGRFRSLFGGAVRVYWPGFSETDDPYRHRLVLAERLTTEDEIEGLRNWLCQSVAHHSLEVNRLGREILEFSEIRATSSRVSAINARNAALDAERERISDDLIAQLQDEIERKNREIDGFVDEIEATEARALASEREYQSLLYRIRVLEAAQTNDIRPDKDKVPESWHELSDWIAQTWPDRILLTPAARRMLRDPGFDDLPQVVRAINWLAQDHYERRIKGGGSLREFIIEPGLRNSACGSDTYSIHWRGQTHQVDWHIKNGGNTRNPARCLRIYYFWDPQTQTTVIDHLPRHRTTDIT